MKPVAIILLFSIFCSCKKDKDTLPPSNNQQSTDTSQNNNGNNGGASIQERDYMFVPMKDVTWIVHWQGTYVGDPNTGGYIYDTVYHFYRVITALDKDTIMGDWHYHLFSSVGTAYHDTIMNNQTTNDIIFINEDTLAKKVYRFGVMGNYSGVLLIDYNAEVGAIGQQNSYVTGIDSIQIDNVYVKRWFGVNTKTNLPTFIQSYGIGRQYGIEYRINGNGAQIKSLDFIYKGDTTHIDFPFNSQG